MADYAVNEIFATIQGEGFWTGTASVFVRLQGCVVGCPWCDTRHTWETDQATRVPELPLNGDKPEARPTWAMMSEVEIAERIKLAGPSLRHVVITGGEPMAQDLGPLIRTLNQSGTVDMVQIETSGTYPPDVLGGDMTQYWLTVSPKIGMPGGRTMNRDTVRLAGEIKWLVGKQEDLDRLERFMDGHDITDPRRICLQPLSANTKATALCVQACIGRGHALSLQTHKLAGIP
jgi:7-carboxy-7-deazaguanine synthase